MSIKTWVGDIGMGTRLRVFPNIFPLHIISARFAYDFELLMTNPEPPQTPQKHSLQLVQI